MRKRQLSNVLFSHITWTYKILSYELKIMSCQPDS